MEHGDTGLDPGGVETGDRVTGPGGLGIPLGGENHADRRVGGEARCGHQCPGGDLGQQRREVALETGDDDLGLGVAEPDVELEDLRARRREHQPGVEDAAVVDAAGAQGPDQRGDGLGHQLVDEGVVDRRDRRVRAHPPGVRSGAVVVPTLEVLGRGQGGQPLAVAQHQEGTLGAGEPFFDDDPLAGLAEAVARQLGRHIGLGLGQRVGDQHALAGGQSVRLDHPRPVEGAQELDGRCHLGEGTEPGRGDAGLGQQLLHERLRPLDPGPVRAGSEDQLALGPQPVGQAVDQRHLGTDDEEVGVQLLGGGRGAGQRVPLR